MAETKIPMIAVLFSKSDVRLGWVGVPQDCHLIRFECALFVRTETRALIGDGSPNGTAFNQADPHDCAVTDFEGFDQDLFSKKSD